MATQAAITTAGLTKHYPGVQALSDLTLEVPAGSIYGFLFGIGSCMYSVLIIV
jgi:ABC-type multidrug transport system ATPase subunit